MRATAEISLVNDAGDILATERAPVRVRQTGKTSEAGEPIWECNLMEAVRFQDVEPDQEIPVAFAKVIVIERLFYWTLGIRSDGFDIVIEPA